MYIMHGEYNAMRLSCNGQDVIHIYTRTHTNTKPHVTQTGGKPF